MIRSRRAPSARSGCRGGGRRSGVGLPYSVPIICGAPRGAARGEPAQNDPAPDSAPAVPLPPAEPEPPLVLDAVGRQKLVEEAAGKSARQVRRMLADLDPELARPADRVRPLGDGRYELKATIDAECPAGAGAAPGAAFARGPAHDDGTARRPGGAGGARPPRPGPGTSPSARRQSVRGREGKRPANSDAGAGAREQRSSGEARRTSGGHRGGAEDRPGRRPPRRFDAGVAVMRFGPRDFGGCQTAGVATRRRALQLRRSTDRAPAPSLFMSTPPGFQD